MFKDLREYIERVKELGELKVVEGADWDLEIGAVTALQAITPEAPMLLFDNIKGYKAGYRVVSNISVPQRAALTLGLPLELKGVELVKALRDKTRGEFKPVPPVEVDTGPVKENVHIADEVDLFEFPTPKWHEGDGGRYIGTGNITIVRDPDEGWVNLGTYRVQIHDKTKATIYMSPGRHADIIRRKYWDKGLSCPVAVACGQDPTLVVTGGMRIPWGISEYDYTGWWKNEPIEVIRGPTTGLPIPASAEIVLEGEMVPPEVESRDEGPFGEWTGHYSYGKMESAFRVKAILHRNDPILMGMPPFAAPGIVMYITWLVKLGRLWDELDRQVPGVRGVWSFPELGSATNAVISIEQKYVGHAKQAAMVALGAGVSAYMLKYVIVVDDDVDPTNLREVLFAIGLRADPEASIDIVRGCWGTMLDPLLTPERKRSGELSHSAAIILATKPYHWIKEFPPSIRIRPELVERVKQKWAGSLF